MLLAFADMASLQHSVCIGACLFSVKGLNRQSLCVICNLCALNALNTLDALLFNLFYIKFP